ncbi:hypothetical protein KR222_000504, partial [Zaprionus bogoriensis]
YLQCINGSFVEVNCTSGSYFNSTLNTCIIDDNGICSTKPEICTDGEIESDLDNPCGYLQCINGSFVEANCTSGSYFNSTLNTCIIDDNGICSHKPTTCTDGEIESDPDNPCGYLQCVKGSFEEFNCTSGSYFNSTLNTCIVDDNGICSAKPEKCTNGEVETNPQNPCGYLQCVNEILVAVNCPTGSYFNSSYNVCLLDESGVCAIKNCTAGEIKANPDDPCGYLQCVEDSFVEVSCSRGSYFNSTLNSCLLDVSGVCPLPEKCSNGEV